jgi:hypothetical protein
MQPAWTIVTHRSHGAIGSKEVEMNVKKLLGTTTAIATVAIAAAAAPAVAADTPTTSDPGVAYFRANERATLVQSAGPAAIEFFRANELKTLVSEVSAPLAGTVNADGRGPLVSEVSTTLDGYGDGIRPIGESAAPEIQVRPTAASGFDWEDAALGASSALMLGLLIGGSLIVVRHSRGRELAR